MTITDFANRYLLTCEALSTTQEKFAFTAFERSFKEFGLPHTIRTDNGVPCASAHALYGLSKLSVWWLRLGIHIERFYAFVERYNHARPHQASAMKVPERHRCGVPLPGDAAEMAPHVHAPTSHVSTRAAKQAVAGTHYDSSLKRQGSRP